MNRPTFAAAVLGILAVAAWAYNVNYRAEAAQAAVERLEAEIALARQDIAVLRAEWAYLNAPERLERLVAAHRARLGGLAPAAPIRFASADRVPFPEAEADDLVALALDAAARSILTQAAVATPALPEPDAGLLPMLDPDRDDAFAGLARAATPTVSISTLEVSPAVSLPIASRAGALGPAASLAAAPLPALVVGETALPALVAGETVLPAAVAGEAQAR
ncbi:MAG: hypothetical protein ACFBWO_16750 [Paracoccaceae bacterium]